MTTENRVAGIAKGRSFIAAIFFLGVLSGFLGGIVFQRTWGGHQASLKLAEFLDLDEIHLKNGMIHQGKIVLEDKEQVVVKMEYGTLKLLRGEIETIDYNPYAHYTKEVW